MEDKMMKRGFCTIALAAAVIALVQPAVAQNYQGTPKPTVRDYGPVGNVPHRDISTTPPAPGKCGNPAHDCLFYGGDFLDDPFNPNIANGLANENTTLVSGTPYGAAVWIPFTVPAGKTWNVKGLFTNNLSSFGVLDQGVEPRSVAFWSINEGVFPGNAGTVVDSGTSPATSTKTGRAAFNLTEYTVQVTGLSVVLTAGSYWMMVNPTCTNTANPFCDGVFFATDVEYINTKPTNAYGQAEPIDAAFFDSPVFGVTFDPTNSTVGACAVLGCDAFSAGVLGLLVE
jgi:hypothetical protein